MFYLAKLFSFLIFDFTWKKKREVSSRNFSSFSGRSIVDLESIL